MAGRAKNSGWVIALGAGLGAAAGAVAGHTGVWLAIGVAIGLVLGMSARKREPACPECAVLHRVHEARRQG